MLKNAEEVIDGFSTKLKVEYDDQDLKGLMDTVQREKLSSSQVPEIVVNQRERTIRGMKKRNKFLVSLFLVIYIIIYFVRIEEML